MNWKGRRENVVSERLMGGWVVQPHRTRRVVRGLLRVSQKASGVSARINTDRTAGL